MTQARGWRNWIVAAAVACAAQSAVATAQDFDYKSLKTNPTPAGVGAVIERVARVGRGTHHFLLTYCTSASDVVLPPHIRRLHPTEITVVLEWRFWNLRLVDDKIHVTVSFSDVPAQIVIPLRSLTYFSDPTEKLEVWLRAGETSEERCASEASVASVVHSLQG